MSGTQSTITDRFPLKKPIRHGSILNRESPTDKKQKVERSASHDFDPTGKALFVLLKNIECSLVQNNLA